MAQMAKDGSKLYRMAQNCTEWLQKAQNVSTWLEIKVAPKVSKLLEIVKNDSNYSKVAHNDKKIVEIGFK